MFLKTFSAGWSSGDCSGVVCATVSRQEISTVMKRRKDIARVAPDHPRARCWSISNRPISLAAESVRTCGFFYALFLSNRWATETQQIWGETVSRWGQADRSMHLSRKDEGLITEDGPAVRVVFPG